MMKHTKTKQQIHSVIADRIFYEGEDLLYVIKRFKHLLLPRTKDVLLKQVLDPKIIASFKDASEFINIVALWASTEYESIQIIKKHYRKLSIPTINALLSNINGGVNNEEIQDHLLVGQF